MTDVNWFVCREGVGISIIKSRQPTETTILPWPDFIEMVTENLPSSDPDIVDIMDALP
jgi:hypothetical protein